MATITLREMLNEMQEGKTFSITYFTYSRKRNTGGELRTIHEAKLVGEKSKKTPTGRPKTPNEKVQVRLRKNPNHRRHFTRNIVVLNDGQPTANIVKFYPLLVHTYNNKTVIL